jgi:hypothetical protein
MKITEIVKREWENPDTQRGIVFGMVFAYIWVGIFGGFFCSGTLCGSDSSLALDYKNNSVPYGLLWAWLNPFYFTQQPYMVLVTMITGAMFALQYKLVKMGKISKWLVMANFFTCLFFNSTHVYQESTKAMFGPLVALSPIFILPMILQILPLGWSWNLSDAHWQCGIYGQCISFVNGRLDIVRSDFITHIALVFWIVYPLWIWRRNKTGKIPLLGQLEWAERHWKILAIVWIGFMLFLTIYAATKNNKFWQWTEGI